MWNTMFGCIYALGNMDILYSFLTQPKNRNLMQIKKKKFRKLWMGFKVGGPMSEDKRD